MSGPTLTMCAYICAILVATATCILGQQQQSPLHRKPWPTYSLQNMPQTRFTCHDKILGGYYADAETQCQMFHVCVKVAGVGVQDFRFLCPNGTAFDQEAQICADWGDVDCEQSVLYYGSDNFDLYRLGSGFESKRAPAAEEEEATFHLQRAESADIRRSKETRVDQKSRPDQPPNYTKRFEATPRSSFNNYANNHNNNNHNHNNNNQQQHQQAKQSDAVKKPIVNYYTPTSPTTTSTTTDRYNDESKQEFDDIFKGSHSSHFFSNRNGGREDDFVDHPAKSKLNDFTDYSKKTESTTSGKTRSQPTRSRRIQTAAPATITTSTATTTAISTTTTKTPKITKKVTLQTSFSTSYLDFSSVRPTTSAAVTPSPSTTTPRPAYSNANRFSFNSNDYYTQEKIVPTTYNPGSSAYRVKTTTPKYVEPKRDSGARSKSTTLTLQNETTKTNHKPTSASRKAQKLERAQQKLGPRNSTFVNHNEFVDFAKVKQQQQPPQPFQPAQVFRAPPAPAQLNQPQYYRSRAETGESATTRPSTQEPAPFNATPRQRGGNAERVKTTINPELRPRGFTSRGSINYKATTQRNGEFYTPTTTTTASHAKKFSTLVPKEQYSPTTFKPTTYQKSYDNFYHQTQQQTVRPAHRTTSSTQTTPAPTTTANPYYNVDEDDGQYHPELYEVDFPRNRLNLQRSSTSATATQSTTTKPHSHRNDFQSPQIHLKSQQQSAFRKQQEQATAVDLSDEEELFKTAHSLNFGAASINKLRADIYKAEKTSQQYNSQYSPNVPASSPRTVAPIAYQATSAPSAPSAASTSTNNYYAYSSYSTTVPPSPTTRLLTTTTTPTILTSTSTTTTTTPAPTTTTTTTLYTTRRPFTYATTTLGTVAPPAKSSKSPKGNKLSKGKGKKSGKGASKRPPHADEDTSYDYAYYDSDTLSESPQEYPEYEIAEFAKTRRN